MNCPYLRRKQAGNESYSICEMNEVFIQEDDCKNCQIYIDSMEELCKIIP